MPRGRKKLERHPVNFEHESQQRAVALAQQGRSNSYIALQTGLTDGQITYLLTKGKNGDGYKPGHTYRSEWRNGTSFAARESEKSLTPMLMADAGKRLPPLFVKPTARIAPQ